MEWSHDEWIGLYGEGWGDSIVPDAFSHPAKFRPALIRHIYEHMLGEGWLKPGDAVLDPFAGVALGALHAMHNGLHWTGLELEQRFCDMGAGLDCTGISAADWVRFYGRWPRAARLEGRAWCPRCLAEAAKIDEAPRDTVLFAGPPSASYRRNSGQIPSTEPHHYRGNLDLWRAMGLRGTAVLLQGDSRKLLEVLRGEVEGCVSSPPYAEGCQHTGGADKHPEHIEGGKRGVAIGYDAAVASPPYADSMERSGGIDPAKSTHIGGPHSQMHRSDTRYGNDDGQLGAMPEGPFDAAVSSPPFGAAETRDRSPYQGGFVGDMMGRAYTQSRQGDTDGNLGGMETKAQDFEAVVSSPPFEDAVGSDDPDKRGGLYRDPKRRGDVNLTATYGDSPGQLGAMRGGFEGAVSSPPWENVEGSNAARKHKDPEALAEERAEGYRTGRLKGHLASKEAILRALQRENDYNYGNSPGQLGVEQADTFWSAARTIIEQVYAALVPGGHAVWVTKAFVRDGERVDFPGQWRQLCEAVGFVALHEHHAMLVEDNGTQLGFFEDEHLVTERKSFFRRLAESKGSPPIDWETVWCMEKPEQAALWTS